MARADIPEVMAGRNASVRRLAGALACAAIAGSAAVPAGATEFPWLGSSGDAGFKDLCPAGQFLIGLDIRSGSWMDQLSVTCATVRPDGSTADVWHGPSHGGDGGKPSGKTCPPGHVIRQMGVVFTGGKQQVKYVSFDCRSTTADQRQTLEIGAPATVFPDEGQRCPDGEAANGLQGRFGRHVNAVGLECAPLKLPLPPVSTGGVPPEWADMLAAHNRTRADHCVGPLTWNAQLAAAAQAYAQQCKVGVHGSAGENLADFITIANGQPVLPAASNATAYQNAWACEVKNYNFDNPVFNGGFTQNCAAPVNGHFTQIVWKDTTQLGCGKATCAINGQQGTHWVCRYLPTGNVNVGDPNVLRAKVLRPPCR